MTARLRTEELKIDTVRPLVQSFIEKIKGDQWRCLASGSPDDATKILMAELFLEMISTLTKSAALTSRDQAESGQRALSRLDASLPRSLSQALGIPDQANDVSLKSLTELIQQEVRENLDSALSGNVQGLQHVTTTSRLNAMVSHAAEVFKKYAAKMKTLFSAGRRNQREEEGVMMKDQGDAEDTRDSPDKPQNVSSGDSSTSQISETIQEELQRELSEIITPLLDDVPNSECKRLQSETSAEIRTVAADVASLLNDKKKNKLPFGVVKKKIKSSFSRCFAKVWICRMLAQLERKHPEHIDAEISESVESFIDELTSQFLDGENQQVSLDQDPATELPNNVSGDKVLVFTKALSDFIYRHSLPEPGPDCFAQSRCLPIRPLHAEVYSDIWSKSRIFMVLMKWFMRTQVKGVSERVSLPTSEAQPDTVDDAASEYDEEPVDDVLKTEKNKTFIKFFIEKVVFHVCNDAKMMPENRYDIMKSLFEKVWAEVQEAQLHISKDTFKSLDQLVHQGLCVKVGSPELVLFLMNCEDQVIVEHLIWIIQKQLGLPPKQPNAIQGFISSVSTVLSRSFRSTKIQVM